MAHVYVRSGAAGAGTGADWANAYLTLGAAFTAKAAGDQFWVAVDHSESTAGALLLTSPGTAAAPCTIRCVNHAGTVPPVSADLTSGAIVATTGANSPNLVGFADCDGVEFRAGDAGNAASINFIPAAASRWQFGSGTKLTLSNTNASSRINLGNGGISCDYMWHGVIVKFGAVGQGIAFSGGGRFIWREGSIDPAGSSPTILFLGSAAPPSLALIEGVDLTYLTTGKTLVSTTTCDITFKDCKIDPAVTFVAALTTTGARVQFSRTNGATVSYAERQYLYQGNEQAVVNVIRAGSLTSNRIDTTANAKFILPYRGLALSIYNNITLINRTVTVYGIANMAAMPLNDQFWVRVEYLGAATSTLGSFKTNAKADILATGAALTADTSAWDVGATARADSTAYVVGDVVDASTNVGRVFFCTTAGTTAASIPAGFGTAIDGGTVTDGTAVFRAGWRFKIPIVLTSPQPGLAGLIYVYPSMGVASAQIYLNRKLDLN